MRGGWTTLTSYVRDRSVPTATRYLKSESEGGSAARNWPDEAAISLLRHSSPSETSIRADAAQAQLVTRHNLIDIHLDRTPGDVGDKRRSQDRRAPARLRLDDVDGG